MATYTWTLQGSVDTTIGETDLVQFAGGTFDSAINVGEYNDSTHIKSSGGADQSEGNTPRNNKFISQTGGTAGKSQADWGDGTEDLDQITNAECALKINFSDSSAVAVSNHIFYAYDGETTTNGPTGVTFVAAQSGDENFTGAEGSGSALSLDDSSAATSHDFFIVISVSPDSVGEKTAFALRDELTFT